MHRIMHKYYCSYRVHREGTVYSLHELGRKEGRKVEVYKAAME